MIKSWMKTLVIGLVVALGMTACCTTKTVLTPVIQIPDVPAVLLVIPPELKTIKPAKVMTNNDTINKTP